MPAVISHVAVRKNVPVYGDFTTWILKYALISRLIYESYMLGCTVQYCTYGMF